MHREVYSWRQNARINLDPNVAVKELKKIQKKHGILTRSLVLKEARNKKNPLHPHFDWDDTTAGEKFRLSQAGYILRMLKVTIVQESNEGVKTIQVPVFRSLGKKLEDGKDNQYYNSDQIASDARLRSQVLSRIWLQLLNLRRQYSEYQELTAVWKAIDTAQESMLKSG